jgi:hypothetical protein
MKVWAIQTNFLFLTHFAVKQRLLSLNLCALDKNNNPEQLNKDSLSVAHSHWRNTPAYNLFS